MGRVLGNEVQVRKTAKKKEKEKKISDQLNLL
jgi:hypothetical protein